jgi:hypothetical protein
MASTVFEWCFANKGLTFASEAEADQQCENCKWKKCGPVTSQSIQQVSEHGECSLTLGNYVTCKYVVAQTMGRYKILSHKTNKKDDVVVRPVKSFGVKMTLLSVEDMCFAVGMLNDDGKAAVHTFEKGHNFGYANVKARQSFNVPEHVPISFAGYEESGRCNLYKALRARQWSTSGSKPVIKRPSAKQTVLKFKSAK